MIISKKQINISIIRSNQLEIRPKLDQNKYQLLENQTKLDEDQTQLDRNQLRPKLIRWALKIKNQTKLDKNRQNQ